MLGEIIKSKYFALVCEDSGNCWAGVAHVNDESFVRSSLGRFNVQGQGALNVGSFASRWTRACPQTVGQKEFSLSLPVKS